MWRVYWCIHLWVLLILLFCTIRYDWLHANIIFLWVYGLHMLWFFPDAWNCWLPCLFTVCSPHISLNKMRVNLFQSGTRWTFWFISHCWVLQILIAIDFLTQVICFNFQGHYTLMNLIVIKEYGKIFKAENHCVFSYGNLVGFFL